jgi:chemotaxis protein MotB
MKHLGRLRSSNLAHAGATDSEGTWAVSYGDMITLLLTFFILFFSIDTKSEPKKDTAMDDALIGILTDKTSEGAAKAKKETPENLQGNLEAILGENDLQKSLAPALEIQAHPLGSRIVIEFPNVSFFEFSQTQVNAQGFATLKGFVKKYMPFAGQYILGIRAYTDNTPVRPGVTRYDDNLELSALRSVSAMRILQNAGIPLSRMRLGGYGELKLTAEDLRKAHTEKSNSGAGLAVARRVVLVIEPEAKEKL